MPTGVLDYALTLDNSGFNRPMGSSMGAVGSFGAGIGALGGGLAAVGTGIVVLGAKVLDLAKQLASAAAEGIGLETTLVGTVTRSVRSAAAFEKLRVSFEALIGDATKAKRVFNEITGLADATPFEDAELFASGKVLASTGEEATRLSGILAVLGEAAAGTGKPIEQMALAWNAAKNANLVTGEVLQRFGDAGVPLLGTLATMLGVSTGEVKKLAEQGSISLPLMEQAFEKMTTKGGIFFEQTKKQSKTFEGRMSTLRSAIDKVYQTIGEPIDDWLKPILDDATSRIASFGALLSLSVQMGNVGGVLAGAFNAAVVTLVNALAGGITFIGDSIVYKLGSPLQTVAAAFVATIASGIEGVKFALGKIPGVGEALGLQDTAPPDIGAYFDNVLEQMQRQPVFKMGTLLDDEPVRQFQEALDAAAKLAVKALGEPFKAAEGGLLEPEDKDAARRQSVLDDFEQRIALAEAELDGDRKKVDQLKREARVREEINRLIGAGVEASRAEAMARQLVYTQDAAAEAATRGRRSRTYSAAESEQRQFDRNVSERRRFGTLDEAKRYGRGLGAGGSKFGPGTMERLAKEETLAEKFNREIGESLAKKFGKTDPAKTADQMDAAGKKLSPRKRAEAEARAKEAAAKQEADRRKAVDNGVLEILGILKTWDAK